MDHQYGRLAQLVEQLTLNQWAQGSSPWSSTRNCLFLWIFHRNGLFSCLFCPIFVSFVHFYPLFGGYFLLFSPCWGTNWGTDWGINWSVNWGINWGIKSPTFIFSILSINKNIPTSLLPEVNIHPTNRYTCHLKKFFIFSLEKFCRNLGRTREQSPQVSLFVDKAK